MKRAKVHKKNSMQLVMNMGGQTITVEVGGNSSSAAPVKKAPVARSKGGALSVKNDADTALDGIMNRKRRM